MDGTIIEDPFAEPCRAGQKSKTCRYIIFGGQVDPIAKMAFQCAKHNPVLAMQINFRVQHGRMNAVGDNCEGKLP